MSLAVILERAADTSEGRFASVKGGWKPSRAALVDTRFLPLASGSNPFLSGVARLRKVSDDGAYIGACVAFGHSVLDEIRPGRGGIGERP